MKLTSRIAALLLAVAVVFTLAGCHQKGETVMTVGETQISSGLYLAFQMESFSTFIGGVNEQMEAEEQQQIQSLKDYFNYEYEGLSAEEYIASHAEIMAVEYAVVQAKFAEYELELTKEETDYADSYAEYYWQNSVQPFYEANGVSLDSYKTFIRFQVMQSKLFEYYYDQPDEETGKGGLQQVADKDLLAQLGKSYVLADTFSATLTDSEGAALPEEEIKQIKEQYEAYAQRINDGEEYAAVYEEATGSALQADTVTATDAQDSTSVFPSSATAYAVTDTSAPASLLAAKKDASDFAFGTAYVLGGQDDGAYYVAVLYDISKDNYYMEQYRSTLLHKLKDDAFTDLLAEEGKALKVEKNEGLLAAYKPANMRFVEAS